jgi:nucleoside recognition membrane protein YjiH
VNEVATQKSRKPEPTQAGYVLGVISALVGFFSAVPVVMWTVRDNVLSKASSILIVFMIILGFFFVGAAVLRLFGIRILKQPDDSR